MKQVYPSIFLEPTPSLDNDQLKEKTRNSQWTEPKFRFLAETIIKLKQRKVRDINQAASKIIGRSHQAIEKISTKTEYKRIERSAKFELSNNNVENSPQQNTGPTTTTTGVKHSLQQTKELSIIFTYVEHSLSPSACVEHSPQLTDNTGNSHRLPPTTISSVEQTPLHEQVRNCYIITAAIPTILTETFNY